MSKILLFINYLGLFCPSFNLTALLLGLKSTYCFRNGLLASPRNKNKNVTINIVTVCTVPSCKKKEKISIVFCSNINFSNSKISIFMIKDLVFCLLLIMSRHNLDRAWAEQCAGAGGSHHRGNISRFSHYFNYFLLYIIY